jgi:hypothetical protein
MLGRALGEMLCEKQKRKLVTARETRGITSYNAALRRVAILLRWCYVDLA